MIPMTRATNTAIIFPRLESALNLSLMSFKFFISLAALVGPQMDNGFDFSVPLSGNKIEQFSLR